MELILILEAKRLVNPFGNNKIKTASPDFQSHADDKMGVLKWARLEIMGLGHGTDTITGLRFIRDPAHANHFLIGLWISIR